MILLNQQTGLAYPMEKEILIGRGADCQIVLMDEKVSRHHARIHAEKGKFFIQDLGSKNGTFVNNERIAQPKEIAAGDAVRVGKAVFLVRSGEEDPHAVPPFTDHNWLTAATLTQASVDMSQCTLDQEAVRISDAAESARLKMRLAAIAEINRALRDLKQVALIEDTAVRQMLAIFPIAKRAMIVFSEAPRRDMAIRAFRARPGTDTSRIGTSRTIVSHVLETGEALTSANPQTDDAYAKAESVARYNIHSFMCAPLRVRDRVDRVIYVDTLDTKDAFDKDDLTLLCLIAQEVSLYLENASLLEDLNREKISLLEDNTRLRRQEAKECDFSQIIGSSKALQDVIARAKKAATARSTVLLTGQCGTGKELFARAIHYNSERADKPFIAVNCAAIAEQLIESELFGHVKGAFTGADKDRKGQFEAAHGGTLLLDEIADMPLEAQAEVLRVLENGEIKRVGATETLSVDVRVIASTNKNLEEEIETRRFRKDLFFRLNVFPIHLPALCERKEDILPLLYHYLKIYTEQMNKRITGFSKEAVSILRSYPWPGNVRELRNAVERMALEVDAKEVIGEADVPLQLRRATMGVEKYKRMGRLPDAVAELQKEMITEALRLLDGNKAEAARHLGLSRAGLQQMLKRFGLS